MNASFIFWFGGIYSTLYVGEKLIFSPKVKKWVESFNRSFETSPRSRFFIVNQIRIAISGIILLLLDHYSGVVRSFAKDYHLDEFNMMGYSVIFLFLFVLGFGLSKLLQTKVNLFLIGFAAFFLIGVADFSRYHRPH